MTESKTLKVADEIQKAIDAMQNMVVEAREQATTANADFKAGIEDTIKALEAKIEEQEKAVKAHRALDLPGVEVERKDRKGFSLVRALQIATGRKQHGVDYGYEEEVNKATREIYEAGGIPVAKAAVSAETGAEGGFLIATELHNEIMAEQHEMFLNTTLGFTRVTGLTGDYAYTVSEGGVTAAFIDSENDGDAAQLAAETAPTFRQFTLQPRVSVAVVPMTWKMLSQPAMSVEADLRRQMALQHGLHKDTQILTGTGLTTNVEGILANTDVGSFDYELLDATLEDGIAATGMIWNGTYHNINVGLLHQYLVMRKAQASHMVNPATFSWLVSPEARVALSAVKDQNGRPLYTDKVANLMTELFGLPVRDTTIISQASVNTDENVILADWSKGYIGEWAGVTYAMSSETETNFRRVRTSVRSIEAWDFKIAYPKSFNKAVNFDCSSMIKVP